MFHEGGQYPCGKCDCRAAERGSLVRHIKSIHEGERCPCEKCDCKATQRGVLDSISSQYMKVNDI